MLFRSRTGAAAIAVEADELRVAFLARDGQRLSLVQWASGRTIETAPLVDLPGPTAASAVGRTPDGWTWVAELESGRLVSRGRIDPWVPARPPVHPLQIVTSQTLPYLLAADPARGPKLDELPAGNDVRLGR